MKPCSRVYMDIRDLGPVYASVTLSTCVDSYPCLVPLVMTHNIYAINDGGSGQKKRSAKVPQQYQTIFLSG